MRKFCLENNCLIWLKNVYQLLQMEKATKFQLGALFSSQLYHILNKGKWYAKIQFYNSYLMWPSSMRLVTKKSTYEPSFPRRHLNFSVKCLFFFNIVPNQGGHTKNPPQKTHPGFFKKPKGFWVFGFLWFFLKIIKISHSN